LRGSEHRRTGSNDDNCNGSRICQFDASPGPVPLKPALKPNTAEWFESATLPRELAKEFGSLGVLGMHLDKYGCAGTKAVSYGLACLELEAGDSGFRSCT
jgi:hypothetical protein